MQRLLYKPPVNILGRIYLYASDCKVDAKARSILLKAFAEEMSSLSPAFLLAAMEFGTKMEDSVRSVKLIRTFAWRQLKVKRMRLVLSMNGSVARREIALNQRTKGFTGLLWVLLPNVQVSISRRRSDRLA